MPTGACGIDCDACGLLALGSCSTCGPGRSVEARRKLQAQQQILGAPCPLLACAVERGIDHCSRDCASYPCGLFESGPYPFSPDYLKMQKRRRQEPPPDRKPSGEAVEVPFEYWDELGQRDLEVLCRNAGARPNPPGGILLPFLKEYLLLEPGPRRLLRQRHARWEPVDHPLLELICLVYLLNASPSTERGQMVGVRELKNAHFFTGPHDLDLRPLETRFGSDLEGFRAAAEGNGGEAVNLADAAYRFQAFPKVPLFYLLWAGDREFPPRFRVLFDRSIEAHLAADAIWGLVNLVSKGLLYGS